MSKKELCRRYVLFVISLFFCALGVALSKHAGLGVSPISSVANILSCRFTFLSLGNWLIVWNCLLVLGQILLLRKQFQMVQLLQIPLSLLFGFFTDWTLSLIDSIPTELYSVRLLLVGLGIVVIAFGITLAISANVIMNSGEAFVKAVAAVIHKDFGNTKIGFDVACVIAAVLLSLCFFSGNIVGTREGTILTAVLTGFVVKLFSPLVAVLDKRLGSRA